MNIYAVAPLIATLAYFPLIFSLLGSRPWTNRHWLFLSFLVSAQAWSLADYFFRGNFFPVHNELLFKFIVITFALMVIQFHCFSSSFFPSNKNRWIPLAYTFLGVNVIAISFGLVTSDVIIYDEVIHGTYRIGVLILAATLLTLAIRNYHVFRGVLKNNQEPVIRNQVVSLIIGISVMIVFTLTTLLPWGKEFPISHFGNLINAIILSYAVTRHELVDIRLVLRKGTAWFVLFLIGASIYLILLIAGHYIVQYELDFISYFIATGFALFMMFFIMKIKRPFLSFMTKAFQGPTYNYRRRLNEFSDQVHNIFSLKEQGGELLSLLSGAINSRQVCLMFPEIGTDDYSAQYSEPQSGTDFQAFRLRAGNPIIQYLQKERKILARESLSLLPAFLGMWPQEREEIESRNANLFVPLISRDRLIAILIIGDKVSGRYSLEDFTIIEDVTSRVAVSMEKEYLREELREREEELSVINNSSVILTSSLDIQEIFGNFLEELRKVIDVTWASIIMLDDDVLICTAISSSEFGEYKPGEIVPTEGTGTGWVTTQKKTFIEQDMTKDHSFESGEYFCKAGLRTMVYLPLISKGNTIGSFLVASSQPYAYSHRHIKLLEQLASQIALPLENAQLYARAEKRARIDELTGLLNRRSLDEMIDNEISRHSRYGGVFSLVIIDLDRFKSFNDTYGHLSGDHLLREVGKGIKLAIRNADRAFRYGGDEFAVLLPQTDNESAVQVAERIRQKINAIDTREISVTGSLGLSTWPEDGVSHMEIIASADDSLYHAKRCGGNQVFTAAGIKETADAPAKDKPVSEKETRKMAEMVFSLADTVDARSGSDSDHSRMVQYYATMLGSAIGLEGEELTILEDSARLHDIGKVGINPETLRKGHVLSEDDKAIMKLHPQLGAEIVANIPDIAACQQAIMYHHENYDGTGYPQGIKGKDIPLHARIIKVADYFAWETANGPGAKSPEEVLDILKNDGGKQFDPMLTEAFIDYYLGNLAKTNTARR